MVGRDHADPIVEPLVLVQRRDGSEVLREQPRLVVHRGGVVDDQQYVDLGGGFVNTHSSDPLRPATQRNLIEGVLVAGGQKAKTDQDSVHEHMRCELGANEKSPRSMAR